MEIARLVLDYLAVLVWPLLLAAILWRYRTTLDKVALQLKDAREFNVLGVGWKLRQELTEISASLPEFAQEKLRKKITESAVDDLQLRVRNFERSPLKERLSIAADIEHIAQDIPLAEALKLSKSVWVGERVAAGIILGIHLSSGAVGTDSDDLHKAISQGLKDPSSFVRYRYAKILQTHPALATRFEDAMKSAVRYETNEAVADALETALSHVG